MPTIDSQVHAYEANTPQRSWHNVPNWPKHAIGDEIVAAMDRVRVDGAIFSAFYFYATTRATRCRCNAGIRAGSALSSQWIPMIRR
jgi:hypothetical protein